MSFRLEDKIILHISDRLKIKNIIKINTGIKLYPSRKISSIYFDNKYLDMFKDSEEGSLPRKKIRIRSYPEQKNNTFNLETKITSVEGKFKKSEKITDSQQKNFLINGIFDSSYGLCKKIVQVSYDREYWLVKGARITIDHNVNYENPINQNNLVDNESLIIEIKSIKNIINVQNLLSNILPLQKQRFSKYCEGINKIYNQNYKQRLSY